MHRCGYTVCFTTIIVYRNHLLSKVNLWLWSSRSNICRSQQNASHGSFNSLATFNLLLRIISLLLPLCERTCHLVLFHPVRRNTMGDKKERKETETEGISTYWVLEWSVLPSFLSAWILYCCIALRFHGRPHATVSCNGFKLFIMRYPCI